MKLLEQVKSEPELLPPRVLLYGPEGVGKTTWGAGAHKPLIVGPEDGTGILHVPHITVRDMKEFKQLLQELYIEHHDYKTLVVDTIDWLEPLVWREVCDAGGKVSIEDFGFGRGYVAAMEAWRKLLEALDKVRIKKSMSIVLLAHSVIKAFRSPSTEDYDRFTLRLHEKSANIIKEWCDMVLFATWEVYAVKGDDGRTRGVGTGTRVVYTERTPAWDAKSRYRIPDQIPLRFEALANALANQKHPNE